MSEKPIYDWQDADEIDLDDQDEYLSFKDHSRDDELELEESEDDYEGDDEY